jgi:fructose-1,6-bisphosphatase/inositol monophosphatase family enzyme
VVDGMILEVGHEAGHIDDGHPVLLVDGWRPQPATTVTPVETQMGGNDGTAPPRRLLDLLNDTADAIAAVLHGNDDWGLAGTRPYQYRSDLAADAVAVERLRAAGCGVLSEESGVHGADRPVLVVVDPLDGSTNASHRIPWYATSLCAVDAEGPLASVVLNLASGVRYEAIRGEGAWCDGRPLTPSGVGAVADAIVAISGLPPGSLGWRQFRCLGAAALDLCAVAAGVLDGFVDCSDESHGAWDYMGALLVCREAGASVADAFGRDLVVREHGARRTPVGAATTHLLDDLLTARRRFGAVPA